MGDRGQQHRDERGNEASRDDHHIGAPETVGEEAPERHREHREPDRQAHREPGVAERRAARDQEAGAECDDGHEARVEAPPGESAARRERELTARQAHPALGRPGRGARRIAIGEGDQPIY